MTDDSRCGHLGDATRECRRAPVCGDDYLGKLSGPVLDRIDMVIAVEPISPVELGRLPLGESSARVARRVAAARQRQHARPERARNAQASPEHMELADEALRLAEQAAERLRLSARGYTRLLRVARTIADLAGDATVARPHVAEALSFRHRVSSRAEA